MDFADVINKLSDHMEGIDYKIIGLVAKPNLKGYDIQDTGMDILPVEYVDQRGCADYGYYGDIYFPTTYSDGDGGVLHLHINFCD